MESIGIVSGRPTPQETKKLWQYFAAISASLLALAAGSVLAWTSPILPQLKDPNGWLFVNNEQGSWIGGLLSIGAIVGAVPAGTLADKLGRKKTILAAAVPYLLSWIIIIFARSVALLCLARTLAGISVGLTCVVVPMYIAEFAEPSIRGVLGSIFQLFISAGVLYGFVFGTFLNYTWFAIICAQIDVVFLATYIWMPESPQWLMGQGRKSEASRALSVFRGQEYDVNEELATMQKSAEEAALRNSSVLELIKTRGARTALFAGLGMLAYQQLTGINAVIFYTEEIFAAAGSSLNADVASIIVALVQTLMSCVAAIIVDRVGRRVLLISSSSILALCLFLLGLYFKLDLSDMGWLPLVSLTTFMIAFALGYGPIPWMMMGELFPPETKGTASVIAVMVNWSTSFLVTKFFSPLKATFGEGVTFWIFTAMMVSATLFGFFIVPETSGKSLQQIQDELNGKNNGQTRNGGAA
ncbi:facilitated trehalose transporter Tret1-like [Diprion similis]|uniref:facilitated trehalose transporter Tret1-like n=1 Tax=Diprion similis TaxID=362088 RepID=UPI001EF938C2|nr:facilitated trehalose transporter Tret1-like [Diprion similis]